MRPAISRKWILFQSILLLTMLCLALVAMRLPPFVGETFIPNPRRRPYPEDPLYFARSALVAFGLAAALLFLFSLLPALLRVQGRLISEGWRKVQRTPDFADFLLQCAMTLCALALGWRAYPYWACGAYVLITERSVEVGFNSRYRPSTPWFDPRYLPPMTWIGEVWRIGAAAVSPLVLTASLILLPLAIVMARRHRRIWPEALVIVVVLLTLLSFLYTPNYLEWLYGPWR